ncbi:putative membrane protein (TIGR02234 family) [Frondihabitans sp. PhB188]|uniref:Trp biosynthesis-associated membrane protein n=1 Tax=Frondihabitans sp. PhB188 TaxID=2485200 RepID=UPI000F4A01C8|nr:Trp biosynthesis-associated membrane protein [Frondihabitans sp. PhB188]ROQ41018.1 putative membrane protein (TIGR02234 family) [Frondihabitans sp. PhB188]
MRTRSTKLPSILIGFALSGVVLLAYTQTWVSVNVTSPSGGKVDVAAAGSAAAPALSALSLAGLALFGAITIAGPVFRVVLGALEVLLGGCVVLSAILATVDPVASATTAITKVTGIAGRDSVATIVNSHSMTAWPWVALVAGLAMAALGVAVITTSRRWPASARRYQAVRLVAADQTADPVVAWDTLTTGSDPTAASGDRPDDAR